MSDNVENQAAEQEQEASLEGVQITITDLQNIAAIIDLASRRGAFTGGDMEQVGHYYGKLSRFLEYAKAHQEASGDETQSEDKE